MVALLYSSIIKNAVKLWLTDDSYSSCFFIFPTSAFLLWLKRDELKAVTFSPNLWGILPLATGLAMESFAYLYYVPYIGMWSIVPVIAGCVLALGGFPLWKVVKFPVCYLLLAGSIPVSVMASLNGLIAHASTSGAAFLGQSLGFVLIRQGNFIQVPGVPLEIMMACSGYKKLNTLISFALLYGYLFTSSIWKRVVLVLAAIPVAVFANSLRITGLIAASSAGGMSGYHLFHSPTDTAALILALGFLVMLGRSIKCTDLRYSF